MSMSKNQQKEKAAIWTEHGTVAHAESKRIDGEPTVHFTECGLIRYPQNVSKVNGPFDEVEEEQKCDTCQSVINNEPLVGI